jgi:two-component system cell cycle response regulator
MLLSRDALVYALFCETDRAQRTKSPLALVHCGIDDWESCRTQLGETAFEAAMEEVAGCIGRLLRCYDSLGGVATGEFVLVLPGCDSVNAASMAERLKREVFGSAVAAGERRIQLAACFGVAASGGRSPFVVLRDADRAFRRARTRGAGAIECLATESEHDTARFLMPELRDESPLVRAGGRRNRSQCAEADERAKGSRNS